ncbi:Sfi1 spindle body protein-domain-containing protein [Neurospora crassa]|nr:Sfi1 spindle body protein-domain-containing protein [Neurospora crassa]
MPPPSSLPLHHRDGRAGLPQLSSSSRQQAGLGNPNISNSNNNNGGAKVNANTSFPPQAQAQAHSNEPYYSNEDIELLHEIVTLAESILPSLPERDRLPTNALFQAAEQILPAHGYPDPDQAPSHISRLIFKIGGQRCAPNSKGETSLLDRFRAVLAGMGIMLEYVPSSPVVGGRSREQSPAGPPGAGGRGGLGTARDKAAGSRSRSVSVSGRSLGGFSSVFSDDDEDVTGGELDIKLRRLLPKRRHSSVSRPLALGGLPIRSRARSASFTDPNALPGDTLRGERARRLEALAQQREQQQREREQLLNRRGRSPEKGQGRRSQLASRSKSSVREYGDDGRPFQPHNPVLDKVKHIPRVFGAPHHYDNAEVAAGALPAYARPNKERPRPISFSSVGGTDLNHKSPRTDFSELHRATSDTTVNTKDEPLPSSHHHAFTRPPRLDPEYQEAKVRMFRTEDDAFLLRDAFTSWHDHFNRIQRDHHRLLSLATQIDDEDIKTEVLEIWLEETVAVVEERERHEAEAEYEAWVDRMERRATRVYEVFTIQNMLNFWQDQAREELDRTAVARRHLIRKRAFDAWRAQHIQDETKAKNFVLIHALQRWTAVALHQEVRRHVAEQTEERETMREGLMHWYRLQKGRVADDYAVFKAMKGSLTHWTTRTKEVQDDHEVAIALDERLLLDEAVNIWQEEAEDLRYTGYKCRGYKVTRDCQIILADWHEQSRLLRTLRKFRAADERTLKWNCLEHWQEEAEYARRDGLLADAVLLLNPVDTWKLELKLKLWNIREDEETLEDTLTHWFLEQRLALFQHHAASTTKKSTLSTWLDATQTSLSVCQRSESEADYFYSDHLLSSCLSTWFDASNAIFTPRHNANLICLYRTTKPCLDRWREALVSSTTRNAYYARKASKQSKRFTIASVLDRWPFLAEQARRERMMTSLRSFRHSYKISLAQSCLSTWFNALLEADDLSADADALHLDHNHSDLYETLGYWSSIARRAQEIRETAADAELDTYLENWMDSAAEMREAEMDAEEWEAVGTIKGCLQRWEHEALHLVAKRNAVKALREREQRRMAAGVLEGWWAVVNPGAVVRERQMGAEFSMLDPRMSTLLSSRRSMRHMGGRYRDRERGSGDVSAANFGNSVSQWFVNSEMPPERERERDRSTFLFPSAAPMRQSVQLPIRSAPPSAAAQQPAQPPPKVPKGYQPYHPNPDPPATASYSRPASRTASRPASRLAAPTIPETPMVSSSAAPIEQKPTTGRSSDMRPTNLSARLVNARNNPSSSSFRASQTLAAEASALSGVGGGLGPMNFDDDDDDEESFLPDLDINDPGFMSTPSRVRRAPPLGRHASQSVPPTVPPPVVHGQAQAQSNTVFSSQYPPTLPADDNHRTSRPDRSDRPDRPDRPERFNARKSLFRPSTAPPPSNHNNYHYPPFQGPPTAPSTSMSVGTSTPSAILASPRERELRRVYAEPTSSAAATGVGVGNTSGILRGGREWIDRERVERERGVFFSDIREESAEG